MHNHIHQSSDDNKGNKKIVISIAINFLVCLLEAIGGIL